MNHLAYPQPVADPTMPQPTLLETFLATGRYDQFMATHYCYTIRKSD